MKLNVKWIITAFVLLLFISTATASSACYSCDDVDYEEVPGLVGMKNPAAVYAIELGYEYKVIKTEEGEKGIVIFPNGDECDAWDFLEGKDGQEYSYCALNGYGMETRRDGKNSFSSDYAVCVPKQKSEPDSNDTDSTESMSVTDLMNLREKVHANAMPITQPDLENPVGLSTTNDFEPIVGTPSTFDWRDVNGINWITPVKNQGSCGSCWAFAALAGVEAKYNIALNDPNYDLDLSEQYLVSDCCYSGDCSGGYAYITLIYIKDSGVSDELCYPYANSNSNCSDRCSDWNERLWKIENVFFVSYESEIKTELIETGPLLIYIGMRGTFDAYGIYRCNGEPAIGHVILLVGYNDEDEYWIAKNSWGTNWGNDGYFKIGYGECSITAYAPLGIDLSILNAPDPFPMPTPIPMPSPYQRPDPIPLPVPMQLPSGISMPDFGMIPSAIPLKFSQFNE